MALCAEHSKPSYGFCVVFLSLLELTNQYISIMDDWTGLACNKGNSVCGIVVA
jgi:hypothetical protein